MALASGPPLRSPMNALAGFLNGWFRKSPLATRVTPRRSDDNNRGCDELADPRNVGTPHRDVGTRAAMASICLVN